MVEWSSERIAAVFEEKSSLNTGLFKFWLTSYAAVIRLVRTFCSFAYAERMYSAPPLNGLAHVTISALQTRLTSASDTNSTSNPCRTKQAVDREMCATTLRQHEGSVRWWSQQREPLVSSSHPPPDEELGVGSMCGLVGGEVGSGHGC
jgi:hypothetical protein